MNQPPEYAINTARLEAMKSPCAKSKRGVVLFDDNFGPSSQIVIAGAGSNGQPPGFACSGSDACRRDCAKLCLHAEDRAIRDALVLWGDPTDLQMLHVKVVGGAVVPGGGPSCWQCSRLVVELGLRGVWLYERIAARFVPEVPVPPEGDWRFYTAEEFHRATLRACGIGDG